MSSMQGMRWAMVLVLLSVGPLNGQHFVLRGSVPDTLGTIGDFDGSGQLDIVCGIYGGLRMVRDPLSGSALPALQSVNLGSLGSRAERGTAGKFNADAYDDLLVVGYNGQGALMTVLEGSPLGLQPTNRWVQLGVPEISHAVGGDFNGDGRRDFAVEGSIGGLSQVRLFIQDAAGQFSLGFTWPPDSTHTYMVVGDYNGDGFDDLSYSLTRPSASGGTLNVLFGSPSLAPTTQVFPLAFGGNPTNFEAADMNADGFDDFVVAESGATTGFQVLFGDPLLGLRPGLVRRASPGLGLFGVNLADVDADGFVDITLQQGGSRNIYVFRGDGNGLFERQAWIFQAGASSGWVWYADFDGDGDQDFIRGGAIQENLAIHGDGCPGTLGVPDLSIGTAAPGSPAFMVTLANALPLAPQQLFIASNTPRNQGWNPGCGIQVRLEPQFLAEPIAWPWFTDSTDAIGGATRIYQIPAQVAAQIPGPFVLQWAVLDPAGAFLAPPAVGVAISRARTLVVF